MCLAQGPQCSDAAHDYDVHYPTWLNYDKINKKLLQILDGALSATYYLQQTTISNFAALSKITNKAWCFMRILCWQTILMKYHALFLQKSGKISQNVLSAAVVILALRVNSLPNGKFFLLFCRLLNFSKSTFSKNCFKNTIRVSNSLDPD